MSLPVALGVVLLGGFGSVLRFALDGAVSARIAGGFPFGTLVVNLSGALALGVLSGAGVGGDALRLAGTGFVGAYTTFSTWMYESQRLAEDGNARTAAVNVALSIFAGALVAWIGIRIGREL